MPEIKKSSGALRFLLPALAVAFVLVLVASTAVLVLGRDSPTGTTQVRQINELVALSQKIPAQAGVALSGNENGFDELERGREVYSQLAEKLGPEVQGLPASIEVLKQSQAILLVREPALTVTRAANEVRELLPQLLQAMGNVVSAMGPGGVEAMSRQLERFEVTGLRVQQDLQALALGVGDPTAIIRRAGDGIDFMGQVIAGLAGEDSGLGLPPVNGSDGQARLKGASDLYGRLSTSVRSALSSADRVKAAREANAALITNANEVYERLVGRVGATSEEGLSSYRVLM
jgi:hypothetical protein